MRQQSLILVLHRETKQNYAAETMTRLEGPAVKNEVLRIIQDWSIEYWEEARWME